jgi:formamidopyrimidine-DNA glycosylase
MPELPEIQTILNGLRRFILNKPISSLDIIDKKIEIKASDLNKIKGDVFSDASRLGKLLFFSFSKNEKKLLIHLKMTGQLIFCSNNSKSEASLVGGHSNKSQSKINCADLKYIRFKVSFKDGSVLVLNDARRFAYVRLADKDQFSEVKGRFGLEPLSKKDLTYPRFLELIEKRSKKNIKAFLLDQSLIAGIGNIYADEILFASKISPLKKVAKLNEFDKKILFVNIYKILKLAVDKKGTTFSDYVDAEGRSGGFLKLLKVYGRDGEKCLKCSGLVKKIKVAGRGTHYCPKCQRN